MMEKLKVDVNEHGIETMLPLPEGEKIPNQCFVPGMTPVELIQTIKEMATKENKSFSEKITELLNQKLTDMRTKEERNKGE